MTRSDSLIRYAFLSALVASPLAAQTYNWFRSPTNAHLYALTAPMTWHQAESEAQRLGGHLATVRSQTEHDWLIQTFGISTHRWIGLSDERAEGLWEWISGKPVPDTLSGRGNGIAPWGGYTPTPRTPIGAGGAMTIESTTTAICEQTTGLFSGTLFAWVSCGSVNSGELRYDVQCSTCQR
jgi:hypothetical protein